MSLIAGALGGVAAAIGCIWWTLRGLARVSERSLLMGQIESDLRPAKRHGSELRRRMPPWRLRHRRHSRSMAAGAAGAVERAGAFFGGGSALLGAALCASAALLRRPSTGARG